MVRTKPHNGHGRTLRRIPSVMIAALALFASLGCQQEEERKPRPPNRFPPRRPAQQSRAEPSFLNVVLQPSSSGWNPHGRVYESRTM